MMMMMRMMMMHNKKLQGLKKYHPGQVITDEC